MKTPFPRSNPDWNLEEDVSWRQVIRPYFIFSVTFPLFAVIVNTSSKAGFTRIDYLIAWGFLFLSLMGTGLINSFNRRWYRNWGNKIRVINFPIFALAVNLIWIFVLVEVTNIIASFGHLPLFRDSSLLNFLRIMVGNGVGYIVFAWLRNRERFGKLKLQHAGLRHENLMAQFEILKQQVNPHFLFNALSTLRSMVREGNAQSEEYVVKLSEILRESLRHKEKDTVTLSEELRFLSAYLFLMEARFEKALIISQNIPEHLYTKKVPAFALQLLLENCIKHNVVSETRPLYVQVFASDDQHLTVENNLQKKQSQADPSGYGLDNLRGRYRLLGVEAGLRVQASTTKFAVALTLIDP